MLFRRKQLENFIIFAQSLGIPRLKIGRFECEMPTANLTELARLKAEIEELKSQVNKLTLANFTVKTAKVNK